VFRPLVVPAEHHHTGRLWVLCRGSEVLMRRSGDAVDLLEDDEATVEPGAVGDEAHFLGEWHGRPVWGRGLAQGAVAPDGYEWVSLYALHAFVPHGLWALAGRAVQIVEWSRTHRYCGRCGTPTELVPGERAMACPACSLRAYPRLSPAVIMLVHNGDELLLARGRLFPVPMYSALAGFVEPGESIEEAVRREVAEEVGVDIGRLDYFGSQPWPFPNSLMLGFFAEYVGGDIVIDETEIVDANWYRYDQLPNVPGEISIASKLIRAYCESRR
jgi:NAD+ diphosphatase